MEFIFILLFHLIGDYVAQPIHISNNNSRGILPLIARSIIYTLILYIGLPLLIFITHLYSGLSLEEFLVEYNLTNIEYWDFGISLYIFFGYLSIDSWTHKLQRVFNSKYVFTDKWWWLYLSNVVNGIDYLLHTVHLYLVYYVIFTW